MVEELHIEGLLDCEKRKAEVFRVLLYRHKHVEADVSHCYTYSTILRYCYTMVLIELTNQDFSSSTVHRLQVLEHIHDGLNAQCLAAAIFIYFTCLSGAIAFGGITAEKTGNAIGIPETLLVSRPL